MSPMDVDTVRAEFPLVTRYAYFQTGTLGPMPMAALRAAQESFEHQYLHGPALDSIRLEQAGRLEQARTLLAGLLGAEADSIGFTTSTTAAINLVAHAYDWLPGDEIVLTSVEHQSNFMPWQRIAERKSVRLITVPAHPVSTLNARIASAMTSHTRLVTVAHVEAASGMVLPVAEICRIARTAGAVSLVDGAQAVGAVRVDLSEIGCDFYAASGHKWLLGPLGSGFLFARKEQCPDFNPPMSGTGYMMHYVGRETFFGSMRRIEVGVRDLATLSALGESLRFLNAVGHEKVRERIADLSRALRAGLGAIPGVKVVEVANDFGASGLTAIILAGGRHVEAAEYVLKEHRVVVKASNGPGGSLRVSTHFFNSVEEVERLLFGVESFIQRA